MKILSFKRFIITTMCCLIGTITLGQEQLEYEPSLDVLVKGEEFYKDGEYQKAIEQFNKVYPGDSLFFRYAIHMKMASLVNLEKYQEVKDVGDKYWYFRHDLPTDFYLNYGTALDQLEEYDKAQEMYKSILKEYPMNYSLWYNLGTSQLLEGDTKEAYSTFKKTIEINPFYDRVHLAMARLAFAEKQTSKGLMALGRYLLHSAERRNNFEVLRQGDYMASSKYWTDKDFSGSNGLDLGGNSDYTAIDQLVHNYVALRSKYKTPSKLEVPLVKQLHLIATQLKEQGGDENDYWYQHYGKFYVALIDDKQFEGFSYFICAYAENEKLQKIIEKKSKDLKAAYVWTNNYLTENSKEADLSFLGFGKTRVERNNKKHYINGLGNFELKDNGQKIVGDITFYGLSGRKTAEGSYNKAGKKDGIWRYYHPNGRLKEKQRMEDGEGVDTSYMYQTNGLLRLKIPFKDGKINGIVSIYNNGVLTKKLPYDNGDVGSGKLYIYHPIGTIDRKYDVVEGKANGDFKSLYDSGETYQTGTFKDGDLQGEKITYFKSGEISYVENYVDNKRDGEYISYFRNGQILAKGLYKEGNKIGAWEYYYRNGNKSKEQNFDEKGKENGQEVEYTKGGWKLSEHSFNKGVVDAYKFYNEKGEILSQGERKRGQLKYISYYQNGIKSTEGQFNKDGRDGEWKFYRYNGALKSTKNYKNGKQVGEFKSYFPDGEVEISYAYDEDGNAQGYYSNRYNSGQLYSQGFVKDGQDDGPWRTYYRDGTLKTSKFFSGSELQGFSTDYDVVGNPIGSNYYKDGLSRFKIYYDTAGIAIDTIFQKPGKRKVNLKRCKSCPDFMTVDVYNNKYHGDQVFYFPDGTLEAKGKVFDGDKEGLWKTYHPNGQLASEGKYADGERNGEWKYYNEDGILIRVSNYVYGDLNGAYMTYNDKGDLDFKANYSYGDKHGEVFYYVGKKQDHKRMYNYGYIESYTFINKEGKEVTKEMKNETADITTYWPNGKKARVFSVNKGWFEGPYKKYYDNGQLAEDIIYKNDEREGPFTSYYRDGTVQSKGQYKSDGLTGVFTTYYENGKKHTEGNYVLNKLHGQLIYYNKDGKIDRVLTYVNGNIIAIEKK